jgi:hypothetical protein
MLYQGRVDLIRDFIERETGRRDEVKSRNRRVFSDIYFGFFLSPLGLL